MFKLVLAGLAIASTLGSAHPSVNHDESDIFKRAGIAAVYSKCTKPNTVAITFDDGPYEWSVSDSVTVTLLIGLNSVCIDRTKVIVDTLNSAKVKGTFFWNG